MPADVQINNAQGWRDDGTNTGRIAIEAMVGDLVRVPFREGHLTSNGAFNRAITGENGNKSSTSLNFSIAAGSNASNFVRFAFYGSVFGICWSKTAETTAPQDFSAVIDGIAYRIPAQSMQLLWDTQAITSVADAETQYIVSRDLGPGMHVADIVLTAHPTLTVTYLLFGYIISRTAATLNADPPTTVLCSTTTITTTPTAISYGAIVGRYPRALDHIDFYNSTAGAITVTLANGATTIWSRSVPANDTLTFAPPKAVTVDYAQTKVSASANTSIAASVYGSF